MKDSVATSLTQYTEKNNNLGEAATQLISIAGTCEPDQLWEHGARLISSALTALAPADSAEKPPASAASKRAVCALPESPLSGDWSNWITPSKESIKQPGSECVAASLYAHKLTVDADAKGTSHDVKAKGERDEANNEASTTSKTYTGAVADLLTGWHSRVPGQTAHQASLSEAAGDILTNGATDGATGLASNTLPTDARLANADTTRSSTDLLPAFKTAKNVAFHPEKAVTLYSSSREVAGATPTARSDEGELALSEVPPWGATVSFQKPPKLEVADSLAGPVVAPSIPLASRVSPTLIPEEVAAEIEARQNTQLVIDAIDSSGSTPNDKMYAHLIGSYGPDLEKVSIEGIKLEGYRASATMAYLIEVQEAYLQALQSHPDTTTACRKQACEAVFGPFGLDEAASTDVNVVTEAIAKMKQAVSLAEAFVNDPVSADKRIGEIIEGLEVGGTFFFPITWYDPEGGHAMVMELEKQSDDKMMMRIFNLGAGIQYHTTASVEQEQMVIPFQEVINIDTSRLLGGAFTSFMGQVASTLPTIEGKWNGAELYEVMMAAVGGEVSSRTLSRETLRAPQYIGNCAMASAVAIMDKSMVSENLAERMRFITLARATKAYYEGNKDRLISGEAAEARRRMLLKGIKATLEQAERALETRGLIGDELAAPIEALKAIQADVLALHKADIGPIAAQAIDLADFQRWETVGALPADLPLYPFNTDPSKRLQAIARPNGADLQVTLSQTSPKSIAKALRLGNEAATAKSTSAKDSVWIVKESLEQLPVTEEYWTQLPSKRAIPALREVVKLQELHFVKMLDSLRDSPNPIITTNDLFGLLKTHTVISILTSLYPEKLGVGLPPPTHPYMMGLLGLDDGTVADAAPLIGKGSWRGDLLDMRNHWRTRSPAIGPSLYPTDLFSFEQQPLGIDLDKTTRHIPVNEHARAALRKESENDDYWDDGVNYNDVTAMQVWAATNRDEIRQKFPELVNADVIDQAVQILAGTDPSGKKYCDRMPAFAAGMRSTFLLDAIRTTDPKRLPKLKDLSGIGYTATKKGEMGTYRDPETGAIKPRSLKYWEVSRTLGGEVPDWSMRRREKDNGWHIEDTRVPIANPDFEAMIHASGPDTAVRGPRRRFSPNKAGTVTPLTLDAIFNLGVQEVRELASLSAVPGLQATDEAGLYTQRLADLLEEDRIQLVMDLIDEPEVLEKNLALDTGLAQGLADFCAAGMTLGNLIEDSYTSAFFAYLSRSVGHTLDAIGERTGIPVDTSGFPKGAGVFRQLIAKTDAVDDPEAVKMIHYFRAKSFEGYASITASEAGELVSSVSHLENFGLPRVLEESPRYDLRDIRETFEIRLRKDIQKHLEHPGSRDIVLNAIIRDIDPDAIDTTWRPYRSYPQFISHSGDARYNAFTGRLERDVLGTVTTPKELANDPILASILGEVPKRISQVAPDTYTVKRTTPGGHVETFRLMVRDGGAFVQTMLNSGWNQAFNPIDVLNLPIAMVETPRSPKGGIIWVPVESADPAKVTTIKYDLPHTGVSLVIEKVRNAGLMSSSAWQATTGTGGAHLVAPAGSPITPVLRRVEEPDYTFTLAKEDEIATVHLPRYGLTFRQSFDPATGTNYLASAPLSNFGFIAGGEQYIELLGNFAQYLLLGRPGKDGTYERAVLIPALPFAAQNHEGLTTPTTLERPAADWDESIDAYLYRLDGDTLIPVVASTQEAVLASAHLATILLSERSYGSATRYLDSMDRSLKSTKEVTSVEEMEAIRTIATFGGVNGDRTPDAAAIRLKAHAILHRQIDLKQAKPLALMPDGISDDLETYKLHLNRIALDVRLSDEHYRILSGSYAPSAPIRSRRERRKLGALEMTQVPINRGSRAGPNAPRETFELTPETLPTNPPAGPMLTAEPIFVRAFPEKILDLYALLRNPRDIRESDAEAVAHQLGLSVQRVGQDDELDTVALRKAANTLVELRYRYLTNQLKRTDAEDVIISEERKATLESEVHLLAVMVNAARGIGPKARTVEERTTRHQQLLATYRTVPGYESYIEAYSEMVERLKGDALDEAVSIWNQWVAIESLPIPLTISKASQREYKPVGPHPLERMAPVPEPTLSAADLLNVAPGNLQLPVGITLSLPVTTPSDFSTIFDATEALAQPPKSPYRVTSSDPVVQQIFEEYDRSYTQFTGSLSTSEHTYTLSDETALCELQNRLTSGISAAKARADEVSEQLLSMLNRFPEDPALRMHAETRLLRGAQRELTLADAKAALARGWDASHLHTLNPSLDGDAIGAIFDATMELMLNRREQQRLQRSESAIAAVAGVENTDGPVYQELVRDLKKALSERLEYDPIGDPILLLMETEFDIGLWSMQVPAIHQLAPREQVAALVELAMGLGKTDVITPAVVSVLADGNTLPILVMPEALVPSMAARLQKRMGKAFDREIRVIPIDRIERTSADVDRLRIEMETMIALRTPLVWSSNDIQTLINSYVEDMESLRVGIGNRAEARALNDAWQELFTLMRSSAEIIGDEIHAILDILTSYNFTLGNPEQLAADEMDAVADFLQIIVQHPSIPTTTELPFMKSSHGTPLTDEHFKQDVAPQVVDAIIERGVTNDARCIDLMRSLPATAREEIRLYLQSDKTSSAEQIAKIGFPVLSDDLVSTVGAEAMPYGSEKMDAFIGRLLPADQVEVRRLIKARPQRVKRAVAEMAYDYARLDQRLHNFLAVQKESLRIVFPLTAAAQLGKHYAANRDTDGAIPADEGTPQWDSLFGSSLERLYYSTLLFIQSGVDEEIIREDLIKYVRGLREEVALGKIDDPSKSEWIAAFKERYGTEFILSTSGFTDRIVSDIVEHVNTEPARQLPLIRDYLLPKTEVYRKEIESSTHMFPMIARPHTGLRGMTGTLFNKATFPGVFGEAHLSDTIHRVTERIKRVAPASTTTVKFGSNPSETLNNIWQRSSLGPACIIDTTGYLNKKKTREYAAHMMHVASVTNPKITDVAFYEGDDLKVLSIGRDEPYLYDKSVDPDSLVALWDVSHTTGSDIRLGSTTHAAMIVGKHLRLFELAQAAMRLRRLGSGQHLELVIPEGDRVIMGGKLQSYLGMEIDPDQPLTVDQVIQYALLNELLMETENNYRAVDMRMRMALMGPIMDLLWDPATSAEVANKIYALVNPLFIKEQAENPWSQYGDPVTKVPITQGMSDKLDSWKHHPVVEAIKDNPQLFPNISIDTLYKTFDAIMASDLGPLQQEVDGTNYLGTRQRTEAKIHQKVKEKVKLDLHTEEKLEVRKREVQRDTRSFLRELRRDPYPPRPVIAAHANPFTLEAQAAIPLEQARRLTGAELNADARTSQLLGGGVLATDLLSFDKRLAGGLKFTDPDVQFSLNLAPVWRSAAASPLYSPYDYFQKFPTHALVAQEKATGRVTVKLIDKNDASDLARKLKNDREKPNHSAENVMRLGLYQLQQDRMFAEGSEPIDLAAIPAGQDGSAGISRFDELITKAKLLSGMTTYTEEQTLILDAWLADRDAEAFFIAFSTRLARNLDRTMESFPYSDLGQLLIERDLTEERQLELSAVGPTTALEAIQRLLFDRTISTEERLSLAADLQEAVKTRPEPFIGDWSDFVAPLLPVLFDIRGRNGALQRPDHGFLTAANGAADADALVRRWLVNTFFPTLADEYGAWKTAVPTIDFTYDDLNILQSNTINAYVGEAVDPDAEHLRRDLRDGSTPANKVAGGVTQLEMMAELAHPVWGLPLLAGTSDLRTVLSRAKGSIDVSQYPVVTPVALQTPGMLDPTGTALAMANAAIRGVNLPASLDRIEAVDRNYPFEYLHGLFAFLANQGIGEVDRTEYALRMLPRLYGNKLEDETVYYADYIANSLTPATDKLTKQQITDMLDGSLRAAMQNWPRTPAGTENNDEKWRTPEFWPTVTAVRKFTYDAPLSVATASARWLNDALASVDIPHWFTNGMVYQMLLRTEALVDHKSLGTYMMSTQSASDRIAMLDDFLEYSRLSTYSSSDVRAVERWKASDFDLLVEMLDINTLERPVLTAEQVASRLATTLGNLSSGHTFNDSERPFFKRVIHNIVSKMPTAPYDEQTKVAFGNLVDVTDRLSANSDWDDFKDLQRTIAPLRLAARHPVDKAGRQESALVELRKLFSSERTGTDAVVHTLFIANHLMTQPTSVSVADVNEVLELMQTAATTKPRDHKGEHREAWTRQPDWWDMIEATAPITFNGSQAQAGVAFDWLNKALAENPQTNWMIDGMIMQAMKYHTGSISHNQLSAYADRRTAEAQYGNRDFLRDLINRAEISRWRNTSAVDPLIKLTADNFDLFADLSALTTKGRAPLTPLELTQELTRLITGPIQDNPHLFNDDLMGYGLGNVSKRISDRSSVPHELRNVISDSIAKFEPLLLDRAANPIAYAPKTVAAINEARMVSDFVETNEAGESNIVKAVAEILSPSTNELRRHLYLEFIPTSLFPLAKGTDRSLANAVIETAIQSTRGQSMGDQWEESLVELLVTKFRHKVGATLLGEAIDSTIAKEKPSWLLDAYVLDVLESNPAALDHAKLKEYIGTRVDFVDRILERRGVADAHLLKRYSANDIDLIFELANIETRGRRETRAATVVQALHAGLEKESLGSSAERAIITRMLNAINDRSPEAPSMSVYSPLLGSLDQALIYDDMYRTYRSINTLVNDLRMKVEFRGSPAQNLVRATEELLSSSCTLARRTLYRTFIPERMISTLSRGDTSWIDPVIQAATAAAPTGWFSSALDEGVREETKKLLLEQMLLSNKGDVNAFARSVSSAMSKADASWLLDDFAIEAVAHAAGQVDHRTLATYLQERPSALMKAVIEKHLAVSRSSEDADFILRYADQRFTIAAELAGINTKGRPAVIANELVEALRSSTTTYRGVPSSKEQALMVRMLDLIDARKGEGIDSKIGTALLRQLDRLIQHGAIQSRLRDGVNRLRRTVELNRSAQENLAIAMSHIANTNANTKSTYMALIESELLDATLASTAGMARPSLWIGSFVEQLNNLSKRMQDDARWADSMLEKVLRRGSASQKQEAADTIASIAVLTPSQLSPLLRVVYYRLAMSGVISASSHRQYVEGLGVEHAVNELVRLGHATLPGTGYNRLTTRNLCAATSSNYAIILRLLGVDVTGGPKLSIEDLLRDLAVALRTNSGSVSGVTLQHLLTLTKAQLPQGYFGRLTSREKRALNSLLLKASDLLLINGQHKGAQDEITDLERWT